MDDKSVTLNKHWLAEGVMLLTYIKEETGCNFCRVIHYPDRHFTPQLNKTPSDIQ